MREQRAKPSIPRRASAPADQQQYTIRTASPHRGEHYAGLHPEDQPYTTESSRRRPPQEDTDEDMYEERPRSSAMRYRPRY